jgi:hypothetical protein
MQCCSFHCELLNRIFFPVTAGHQHIPARVRLINEEIFKAAIVDIVKCTAEANLQHHYVGNGAGDVTLAGLGLSPIALMDGIVPSAEILLKCSLHEVKGFLDSKFYQKNPDSAAAAAAGYEAIVLDRINTILAGGQIAAARVVQENQNAGNTTNNTTGNENNPTNAGRNNNNNIRGSRTISLLTAKDNITGKYKKSPATTMAEANLLSQETALKEADDLKQMIEVQKEEMQLQKQDAELHHKECKNEVNLLKAERENTTKALSKLVEQYALIWI